MSNPTFDTGKSKWTYGEPQDYINGRVIHRLLGPCPACGTPCFDYGGGWRCLAPYCYHSDGNPRPSMGPQPTWWLDGTRVFLDGDSWCATHADFVNLQESPAGFGDSPRAAVKALMLEAP